MRQSPVFLLCVRLGVWVRACLRTPCLGYMASLCSSWFWKIIKTRRQNRRNAKEPIHTFWPSLPLSARLCVGNNSLALTYLDHAFGASLVGFLFWFRDEWPNIADHHRLSAELFSIEATATSPTVTKLVEFTWLFVAWQPQLLHTAHTSMQRCTCQ